MRNQDRYDRSIPACAGEPDTPPRGARHSGVYPRVCGGTRDSRRRTAGMRGLSPRVRGNPTSSPRAASRGGSIPACAGEPYGVGDAQSPHLVYPRVCGGTAPGWLFVMPALGLSPRVRGNPGTGGSARVPGGSIPACAGEPATSQWASETGGGSIPACAGEPWDCCWQRPCWRVYPRVCGGTYPAEVRMASGQGLSPRVRGNRYISGVVGLR